MTNKCQLDERLRREGIKTHKERVEDLNRYLSGLSEHHDMYVAPFPLSGLEDCTLTTCDCRPRIGPG